VLLECLLIHGVRVPFAVKNFIRVMLLFAELQTMVVLSIR
jgi:hypothetical protein